MIRICVAALVAFSLGTIGFAGAAIDRADRASASCRGAVPWQSARSRIGRVATVKGPVASTTYASWSSGSPTFLNLGVTYPNPRRVTVVIWVENRARFGKPEQRYRGHTICVRGLVDTYQGVAEIEATSPTQIAIVQ